jgi:hypothetical protein
MLRCALCKVSANWVGKADTNGFRGHGSAGLHGHRQHGAVARRTLVLSAVKYHGLLREAASTRDETGGGIIDTAGRQPTDGTKQRANREADSTRNNEATAPTCSPINTQAVSDRAKTHWRSARHWVAGAAAASRRGTRAADVAGVNRPQAAQWVGARPGAAVGPRHRNPPIAGSSCGRQTTTRRLGVAEVGARRAGPCPRRQPRLVTSQGAAAGRLRRDAGRAGGRAAGRPWMSQPARHLRT